LRAAASRNSAEDDTGKGSDEQGDGEQTERARQAFSNDGGDRDRFEDLAADIGVAEVAVEQHLDVRGGAGNGLAEGGSERCAGSHLKPEIAEEDDEQDDHNPESQSLQDECKKTEQGIAVISDIKFPLDRFGRR